MLLSGAAAGTVNGLFGAGGGMLLVPLLSAATDLREDELFPSSVCIILPICIVSLVVTACRGTIDWQSAWPYLVGSIPGGLLAGLLGKRIPTVWLHRALGALILWGGVRYLC